MEIIIEEIIENIIIVVEENITSPIIKIEESILEYKILVEDVKIPGPKGDSTYQIAVNNGFIGTEAQWLLSLQSGGAVKVYQEIPIGLINGINATFNSQFNFLVGTLEVFLNGMMLKIISDYQVVGNNIFTLNISPTTNENLIINYIKQ